MHGPPLVEASNSTPDKVIGKPDNFKSTVWHFFGFWSAGGKVAHKSNAVCKLRNAVMVYHSTITDTTYLKLHSVRMEQRWLRRDREHTFQTAAFYCLLECTFLHCLHYSFTKCHMLKMTLEFCLKAEKKCLTTTGRFS